MINILPLPSNFLNLRNFRIQGPACPSCNHQKWFWWDLAGESLKLGPLTLSERFCIPLTAAPYNYTAIRVIKSHENSMPEEVSQKIHAVMDDLFGKSNIRYSCECCSCGAVFDAGEVETLWYEDLLLRKGRRRPTVNP